MAPQYDLLGEYDVTLDTKGRFRLPSSLLKNLGDRDTLKLVVNRGYSGCLTLYPKPVWDFIKRDFDDLEEFDQDNVRLKRLFYAGATEIVPDSADRVQLTRRLLAMAKVTPGEKEKLVLSARNDRVEIWAESVYYEMLEHETDDMGALAQKVFEAKRQRDRESLQ